MPTSSILIFWLKFKKQAPVQIGGLSDKPFFSMPCLPLVKKILKHCSGLQATQHPCPHNYLDNIHIQNQWIQCFFNYLKTLRPHLSPISGVPSLSTLKFVRFQWNVSHMNLNIIWLRIPIFNFVRWLLQISWLTQFVTVESARRRSRPLEPSSTVTLATRLFHSLHQI